MLGARGGSCTARMLPRLPVPLESHWQSVTAAPSTRAGSTVKIACNDEFAGLAELKAQ